MTDIPQAISNHANRYTDEPLDNNVLSRLVELGNLVEYSKGDLIVAPGDNDSKLYLLIDGLIRMYYLDYQGNDLTHQFLEAGRFFSTQYVAFSEKVLCNFEAIESCRMVCFDYDLVQKLMSSEPSLTHVYIGILEETLCTNFIRETALLTDSATDRYLKLKSKIPDIDHRVNHAQIASYIGVTPVSLSRIRRMLREKPNDKER